MRLTVLGTGASEGIPAFRCQCPVCREAREKGGRHIRQNASLYLQADNGINVLVDMPPQIKMLLEKYSLSDEALDAILFTHFHIDHTGGIFHLLESMSKNGHVPGKPVKVYMPDDCYRTLMEGMYIDQPDMDKTDYKDFYSLDILGSLEKTLLGELTIKALDTNHLTSHPSVPYKRECHGYLFSEKGKNAAYLVDSSSELPDATISALTSQKLDCLIFECTFDRFPGKGRGHSDHEGVLRILDLLKPERMIISHISHRNFSHDRLSSYMKTRGIETAWDGM
ncbi:MAG: MBL fold metallo-hydrolase, partial [Spirochaetia bacterium]|nr:MBL fold metallo-hydrolase [Spirochaetia bacterium]